MAKDETVLIVATGARKGSVAEEWMREKPTNQGGRSLMQVIADRKAKR